MIRIISNFRNLEQVDASDAHRDYEYIRDDQSASDFIRQCLRSDLVILNIGQRNLMLACLCRWLLPFARFRLVSVDLILRPPTTWKDRLKTSFKKLLLSRVDRFVLYFRNLQGYETFYGVGPNRAIYVPFKVNGWEHLVGRKRGSADGAHVLCAGRTLRDIETFVEAMRRSGLPGVLLQQRRELLAAHGTSAWSGELPKNVELIVDDSDDLETYFNFMEKARLVVIPRFRRDIAATGIGTYLVAMALNKCVVISGGPGAEDVLSGQAVIVPPEDPESLARQIDRLWNDNDLLTAIAGRGHEYAVSLGGRERLLSDVLRIGLQTISNGASPATYSREAETIR